MFTTGDGPSAWQSPTVARMLKEIIGEDLSTLRQEVSRDVVARCAAGELLKPDGSISDAVWRAMAAHRPALVQQARERLYRICVRTFRIEADTVVALVLFYNKAEALNQDARCRQKVLAAGILPGCRPGYDRALQLRISQIDQQDALAYLPAGRRGRSRGRQVDDPVGCVGR